MKDCHRAEERKQTAPDHIAGGKIQPQVLRTMGSRGPRRWRGVKQLRPRAQGMEVARDQGGDRAR